MKSFRYTITDKMVLHAQPSGFLTKLALSFPCRVTVVQGNRRADAKKIFGVMGLRVRCGQEITLETDGDREEEAIEALREFAKNNL